MSYKWKFNQAKKTPEYISRSLLSKFCTVQWHNCAKFLRICAQFRVMNAKQANDNWIKYSEQESELNPFSLTKFMSVAQISPVQWKSWVPHLQLELEMSSLSVFTFKGSSKATKVLYNIILKIIKLADTFQIMFSRLTIHKGCQFSQFHWWKNSHQ